MEFLENVKLTSKLRGISDADFILQFSMSKYEKICHYF